jgi:ATP-dependent helicase HrpA
LAEIPFAQLAHIPRYLKALATRMERAKLNPAKDKERAQLIAPYLAKIKSLRENPPKPADARKQLEDFRWMVEEYKVSLFAQELGTAFPVSPKRLDEQFARI